MSEPRRIPIDVFLEPPCVPDFSTPPTDRETNVKKTTKGAIASGVAVMLLLGGGGTLAYWNDTANLGGKFKAYLSDSTTSAKAHIAAVGPWYLPDATKVFPATSVTSFPSRDLDMDEFGEGGADGGGHLGVARHQQPLHRLGRNRYRLTKIHPVPVT